MKLKWNTIIAKSIPWIFEKEKLGVKANTVRDIPNEEIDDFYGFYNRFLREEELLIEIHYNHSKHEWMEREYLQKVKRDVEELLRA